MFQPITRYIKLLKVPNNGNFPYCNCVYIDDNVRTVIDSGCGPELAAQLNRRKIDVLIITHFHLDHTLYAGQLEPAQIWCHELDADAIESVEIYQKMYGFHLFGGELLGRRLVDAFNLEPNTINRRLRDGEILDFGHVKLKVIHTPGHTPGHTSFFEEESGILFSADIELSSAGPFYAHLCSNLDDYLDSINKCMELHPRLVIGGHNGITEGDLEAKFLVYRDRILRKEEKILQSLNEPATIEDLAARHSFISPKLEFGSYHNYFNKHGVYKHLERLIKLGQVSRSGNLYYRV
ncbi:MAG TPA: MBL fold metallo-hydrolase [Syntrophomonadaceae bacterium]|nr:MBL fold metallo-hydrolase [Syntrophomonadaceae bacterium]